jgi:hypothetical protein
LLNARPGRGAAFLLPWVLFVAGVSGYLYAARQRHLANPDERVTPTLAQIAKGMIGAALRPAGDEEEQTPRDTLSKRFFSSMLWTDTTATARRFAFAMLLLVPAVLLGLHSLFAADAATVVLRSSRCRYARAVHRSALIRRRSRIVRTRPRPVACRRTDRQAYPGRR